MNFGKMCSIIIFGFYKDYFIERKFQGGRVWFEVQRVMIMMNDESLNYGSDSGDEEEGRDVYMRYVGGRVYQMVIY